MVSITAARLNWTGGAIDDNSDRPTAARLDWTGGRIGWTNDSVLSAALTIPKLDRMQRQASYFDAQGRPTAQMQLLWQRHCEAIEQAFAATNEKVNDNSAILARLLAVESQSQSANDNAIEAKEAADAAQAEAVEAKIQVAQVSSAAEATFRDIDPAYEDYYRSQNPTF